jgi:serine/threonine protein kinase
MRARMALDAARGVHYLHSCRPPVLHRDLKSQNILVNADWSVALCDFGLAREIARAAAPSRLTTAEHASPEVIRGDAGFSPASDAWAFGVVLWELFTGREPWADVPPARVIAAVGFGGETLEITDDVPPPIADIVTACWAPEPGDRPDFGELCDRLTAYLKEEVARERRGGG